MKKETAIDPSKPPFHWCPRFEKCSANRCPFDAEIGKKVRLGGEEKCKLAKARRMRLWESLPEEKKALLPYRGMFKREFSGWKRWQDMPEEERNAKKAILRARIEKANLSLGNQGEGEK